MEKYMFQHHQGSIINVIKKLKEDNTDLALIIAGSIAHGFAAHDADLDIMIVVSPEEYKNKMVILNQLCSSIGRKPDTLQRSLDIEVLIAEEEKEVKTKIRRFKPKDQTSNQYKEKRVIGTPEQCQERRGIRPGRPRHVALPGRSSP